MDFCFLVHLYILFPQGNLIQASFENLFFGQDFQACVSPVLSVRFWPYLQTRHKVHAESHNS